MASASFKTRGLSSEEVPEVLERQLLGKVLEVFDCGLYGVLLNDSNGL